MSRNYDADRRTAIATTMRDAMAAKVARGRYDGQEGQARARADVAELARVEELATKADPKARRARLVILVPQHQVVCFYDVDGTTRAYGPSTEAAAIERQTTRLIIRHPHDQAAASVQQGLDEYLEAQLGRTTGATVYRPAPPQSPAKATQADGEQPKRRRKRTEAAASTTEAGHGT